MSNTYTAAFAEVIEQDHLSPLVPASWDNFLTSLTDSEALDKLIETDDCSILDRFAAYIENNDPFPPANNPILIAYKNLQKAFKKKTRLDLYISYHDSAERGDKGDDVDGAFWTVEGMYQLSPAGRKMKRFVTRKHWVNFS